MTARRTESHWSPAVMVENWRNVWKMSAASVWRSCSVSHPMKSIGTGFDASRRIVSSARPLGDLMDNALHEIAFGIKDADPVAMLDIVEGHAFNKCRFAVLRGARDIDVP